MKKSIVFLFGLLVINVSAQTKDTINIAVFLYDGVELLDFAGPAEVFAAASYYTNNYHFNVYTVAKETKLKSQGFLDITPNYSFETAPKTDVLILPGGNAHDALNDTLTQKWIGKEIERSPDVLTVCSGIFFLEESGRLNGIKVTSHHKILPFLKQILKPENVVEEVKYVDSGKIVTSAGVSSGIEGAFLTLSKIAGYEVANRTARYMEYPQWDISNGKITYDLGEKASDYLMANSDKPQFGVLDLAGHLALREGRPEEAMKYFKRNLSFYPKSPLSYYGLASSFEKMGKWAPPVYEDFLNVLRNEGAQAANKIYQETKSKHPSWVLFTLKDITVRIENLIAQQNYEEADIVGQMALETYPNNEELLKLKQTLNSK
ncbi:DJ-1/PfpI family protein [Flagellimonas sp. S174]|uniref:DJ-1/PfpI family protein n=1 Tax=Flagellimonas sp. S174 TaxID=3410790 RepID=UPI003BF50D99